MDIKKRVTLRIKAIRKRRGLTQEALAELIDRSPDTISNIERGFTLPSYDTLEILAKGLGVTLADLFADEEISSDPKRIEAMARLTDAARQLDVNMLAAAATMIETLAEASRKYQG